MKVEISAILTREQTAILMRKMNQLYSPHTMGASTSWTMRGSSLSMSPYNKDGLMQVIYQSADDSVVYQPLKLLLASISAVQVVDAHVQRRSVVYAELRKKHVRGIMAPVEDER